MKIDRIEITNYKAFMGTHEIAVKGKNFFISRPPACGPVL